MFFFADKHNNGALDGEKSDSAAKIKDQPVLTP